MISKQYCPKCESFDLLKLRRNFFHKRILGTENKLQCKACGEVFKPHVFEQNIPREIPVFLENANPAVAAAATPKVPQHPINHDVEQQDDIKITETVLSSSEGYIELSEINSDLNMAPPEHDGDDLLVDEAIFVKEKKGVWPYLTATLLVLCGAAYTFIWMPMTLNAGETDTIQVDMSIGEPTQMLAEVKPIAEFSEMKTQVVEVEKKLAKEQLVKNAIPKVIKSTLQAPKEAAPTVINPRLIADAGTKADNALGGLSSASQVKKPFMPSIAPEVVTAKKSSDIKVLEDADTLAKKSQQTETSRAVPVKQALTTKVNVPVAVKKATASTLDKSPRLVEVPLPKTYLSEDVMVVSHQKGGEGIKSSQKNAKTIHEKVTNIRSRGLSSGTKISSTAPKKEQRPVRTILYKKKAAAILGVSIQDLSALTSKNPVRPAKTMKKRSVIRKVTNSSVTDANAQLVEKAAVKFMEQDLDKLFR